MTNATPASELVFVTAVSRLDVLGRCLCASPCIASGRRRLVAQFNAPSAADAFNPVMAGLPALDSTWLVWVHQDVFLPDDWDEKFLDALRVAQQAMPALAVAGVYGVRGTGTGSHRAGHVLDRGLLLREPAGLPSPVDSLDELLFAVRADTRLTLDGALGYDLYATDLVLQAQAGGWVAAAVDAYCEHWSDTPRIAPIPEPLAERVLRNGRAFEAKWRHRLPIATSWVTLNAPGDIERFVSTLRAPPP